MTYHCGVGPRMASIGVRLSVPHVTCDAPGCGSVVTCCRKDGFPKAWFRRAPRPPGWRTIDDKHYCPRCKGQTHENPATG